MVVKSSLPLGLVFVFLSRADVGINGLVPPEPGSLSHAVVEASLLRVALQKPGSQKQHINTSATFNDLHLSPSEIPLLVHWLQEEFTH